MHVCYVVSGRGKMSGLALEWITVTCIMGGKTERKEKGGGRKGRGGKRGKDEGGEERGRRSKDGRG